MNVFDIKKVTRSDGEIEYSHPSYGMIQVMRTTGCERGLFGQTLPSQSTMNINVSNASVKQDLGKNWYHEHRTIISVEMSAIQYAEMISSPNTQGVPCTIRHTESLGSIEYSPLETEVAYTESALEGSISSLKNRAQKMEAEIQQILKGQLKKADKEELSTKIMKLCQDIVSNIPFYERQMQKSVNRMKAEAKTDIDAMLLHAVTEAGYEAIQTGDRVLRIGSDK